MKINFIVFGITLLITQFATGQNVAAMDHSDLQKFEMYSSFEEEEELPILESKTQIIDVQIGTEEEIMKQIEEIEWSSLKKEIRQNKMNFYRDNKKFVTRVLDSIVLDI